MIVRANIKEQVPQFQIFEELFQGSLSTFVIYMKVKELREQHGLSQQELADKTGIPKDRIAKWEQGKGKPKADDTEILTAFFKEHVPRELPENTMQEEQVSYKKSGTDDRYIRLLEDNDRFFKDLVKSNLSKADYVQHAILAHLKSIIQRDAEAQSSGDDKQQKKIMLAMGKRIAYYMEQPVETDIVPGK